MKRLAIALLLMASGGWADSLMVHDAFIPAGPPTAKTHAAYMDLHNHSGSVKALIGVSAEGYAMAHLHVSEEKNGVATMSALDQIDIAPHSAVTLAPGGMHIMLMRPEAPVQEGDSVAITLEFADGATQVVIAPVTKRHHMAPSAHSDHNHGS